MNTKKQLRLQGALERLEAQLDSGVKTVKKTGEKLPLIDSDINRINKEIQSLKKKLNKI